MAYDHRKYSFWEVVRLFIRIGEPPHSLVIAVLGGVPFERERGERDDRNDQCGYAQLCWPLEVDPYDKSHCAIAEEGKSVESAADTHSPFAEVKNVPGEHAEQQ